MDCTKCGAPLLPGVTRCGQCGTPAASDNPPTAPESQWGTPPTPGPPQYGQPQQWGQPQPYNQPPAMPYQYGQNQSIDPGVGFSVTGIVLGAISFLFCPLVLGITGIVFAGVAKSRRERLANVALAVSIAGTIVGMALGIIMFSQYSSFS